jgi:hypothetical protein
MTSETAHAFLENGDRPGEVVCHQAACDAIVADGVSCVGLTTEFVADAVNG